MNQKLFNFLASIKGRLNLIWGSQMGEEDFRKAKKAVLNHYIINALENYEGRDYSDTMRYLIDYLLSNKDLFLGFRRTDVKPGVPAEQICREEFLSALINVLDGRYREFDKDDSYDRFRMSIRMGYGYFIIKHIGELYDYYQKDTVFATMKIESGIGSWYQALKNSPYGEWEKFPEVFCQKIYEEECNRALELYPFLLCNEAFHVSDNPLIISRATSDLRRHFDDVGF